MTFPPYSIHQQCYFLGKPRISFPKQVSFSEKHISLPSRYDYQEKKRVVYVEKHTHLAFRLPYGE